MTATRHDPPALAARIHRARHDARILARALPDQPHDTPSDELTAKLTAAADAAEARTRTQWNAEQEHRTR